MKNTLLTAAFLAPLLGSCVIAVDAGAYDDHYYQAGFDQAICVIQGTAGNEGVSGTVTFTDKGDSIHIEAEVRGLEPGAHGFHIHQFGDLSSTDGKSAGGHYNPEGHDHSGPNAHRRHEGDLGNLVADANGVAHYSRHDDELSLRGRHSIVGRAIIVHAGEDDLRSQPTGNAGSRIGYGVIGIANE